MCCGGSQSAQPVRTTAVERQSTKVIRLVVENKVARAKPAAVERQHITARQKCVECGYPIMVVHIANRERHQCTNINCKKLVR